MKRCLLWTILALLAALTGCSTCNPEAAAPAADTQGQELGVSDGDGQPSDGQGTELPVDASDALADAGDAVIADDGADTDADGTDVDAAADGDGGESVDAVDVLNAFDTSDAVVGPPIPPTTACGEGQMSTPKPGDPCETEGVTRCSDVGSKWIKSLTASTLDPGYCLQPNLMRCTTSMDGTKAWVFEECAKPTAGCAKVPGKIIMTCQDSGGQGVCAVVSSSAIDTMIEDLKPCSGQSYAAEATGCGTMGPILKCATILTAKPAPGQPWVQGMLDKYAFLKTCCPNCRYWFPYKTCPDMNIGLCWGWNNPEQFGIKIQPVCLENIPGKPPTCVTTCEDLKYSAEFGKPPG